MQRLLCCAALGLLACAGAPRTSTDERAAPPRPAPPLSNATGPASFPAPTVTNASAEQAEPVAAQDLVLARVGGRAIGVRELLASWLHLDSLSAFDQVDKLINTEIALLEAQRLGLTLDPELLDARYLQARAEIERILASNAPGLSPENYVRAELGLDPARYFERVRQDCAHQLIAERVVRAFQLQSERLVLRLIAVREPALRAKVEEGLRAGRDFGELARLYSIDPSAKLDGLVAPVVRDEFAPLARLAFRTPVGSVAGPLEQEGTAVWLSVEERLEALEGDWARLGAMVEASLRSDPIEESEYRQWRPAMERRYAIDLRPMLELAGEPLPEPPQKSQQP